MAKFRILEDRIIEGNKHLIFAAGESDDDKPQGDFVNGSIALEVDTRKVYFWEESIQDWDDGSGE